MQRNPFTAKESTTGGTIALAAVIITRATKAGGPFFLVQTYYNTVNLFAL